MVSVPRVSGWDGDASHADALTHRVMKTLRATRANKKNLLELLSQNKEVSCF